MALRHMEKTLDRLMPVIALSLALLLQGLVGTGVAANLVYPELAAPDGTLLTLADICNTTGSSTAQHCHACTHPHPTDLPTALPVPPTPTAVPSGPVAVPGRRLLSRPEASHCHATGPPAVLS